MQYDALVVLSFGGPEGPEDVVPFLRNVTSGRNVPDDRLVEVAKQYEIFGGVSPLNEHCRNLVDAIKTEFVEHKVNLAVYWGNRNWDPYLTATVNQMSADGVKNALVFTTSAFSSYSGCRQYREDIATAVADHPNIHLDKIRLFYNHPGFIEPMADNVAASWAQMNDPNGRVVFCAHSIPVAMAATSEYEQQLTETATIIADHIGLDANQWDLAFQSRSGPPSVPWLEPDINDQLVTLADHGIKAAVVAPIGFLSDHMEVLFDLDTQAAETAASLGINTVRAATVGTDPRFISMIRELVAERTDSTTRRALGSHGPWPDQCPENHCAIARRPAVSRPAKP